MNILMLGHWLPAARADTRSLRFARHLARAHRLTLAFTTDDPDPTGGISALRAEFEDLEFAVVSRGWKCLSSAVSLATGESCSINYFRSEALSTRLAERMRTTAYGVVFISASSMIQYALELDATVPLVVDFGEVDSEWWTRQAERRSFPGASFYRTEGTRLRRAEATIARCAARCLVSSLEAARVVASFAPWAPTTIVADGGDLVTVDPSTRRVREGMILCHGAFDDAASVRDVEEFCLRALPGVRARVPEACLVIATGRAAGGELTRLARQPGVEIAAGVTSVRPFLQRASVAVVPFRAGAEPRKRVLEAMAAGVPVVATSGARDGLEAQPGRELWVEDAPEPFGLRVVELLESRLLREEMGSRARAFVHARHSWEVSARQVGEVLETVAASRPSPRGAQSSPVRPGPSWKDRCAS